MDAFHRAGYPLAVLPSSVLFAHLAVESGWPLSATRTV